MRSSTCIAVAALALAAFAPAAAAADNPPLTGEVLRANETQGATVTCDEATATGTATFSTGGGQFPLDASGAVGPYPGTFTESGTITIQNGVVTSFQATFTIQSGDTTITGTKTLDRSISATCRSLEGFGGDELFLHSYVITRYQATISGPAGTTTDSGLAEADVVVEGGVVEVAGESELFLSAPAQPTAATVVLSPAIAVNDVGTPHTVTATVETATGAPVAGVAILFTVTGSVAATGSCTTGAGGQCSFTYTGPALPGADEIRGCADTNRNGTVDPGEPCGNASKVWTLPASTPGQVTGGGYVANASRSGLASFGFVAQSDGAAVKGTCNVIDHAANVHVKCLDVVALVQTATHATFFGEATVDGVATNYRIDVDDLGEPGDTDTFKLQTDTGYVVAGTLWGGDIQIHM